MKKLNFTIFACLLAATLFQSGCLDVPNDIILPQWDVNLNIPFVNREYTLNDIITSKKFISVDPDPAADSIYLIESDKYKLTTGVADFIKVVNRSSLLNNTVPASNNSSTELFLKFPEDAELISAEFSKGSFDFSFRNPSPVDVSFNLTVPGIHKPDGSILIIQSTIAANGRDSIHYSFAGHTYQIPQDQPADKKNSLKIIIALTASVTTGVFAQFDFYSSDFFFISATGNLPPKALERRTDSFNLNIEDVADYRDKVLLKTGTLTFSAQYKSPASNPFGISIQNVKIIGKRKDGSTILLKDSTNSSNLNFKFTNGFFTSSFSENNSNVRDFIAFLPDSVLLSAEYLMNPDNKTGTVTIQDSVIFETIFKSKSVFALKKSSIQDTSTSDLESLSGDDRDRIRDASNAQLTVEVENGVPLTGWLKIDLYDKQFNFLTTVTNNVNGTDSVKFLAADVDPNGEVAKSVKTLNVIELDSAQVFQVSKAYNAVFHISLRTKDAFKSPPVPVAVRAKDKIKIRAFGTVKYRINSDN